MRILIDTNILLRAIQAGHPLSRTARMALRALHREKCMMFLTLQILAKFWTFAQGLWLRTGWA